MAVYDAVGMWAALWAASAVLACAFAVTGPVHAAEKDAIPNLLRQHDRLLKLFR